MRSRSIFHIGFVVLLAFGSLVSAQQFYRHQVLAAYIYRLATNVSWPNEDSLSSFKIKMITQDIQMIDEMKNLEKIRTLKGKPIIIDASPGMENIADAQVIFVDRHADLVAVFDRIEGKPVLLISDCYEDRRLVMINLCSKPNNRLTFEVNKSNIVNQGLDVLPELLLLGGSEIDVVELYRQSQQSLRGLQREIADLQQRIGDSNARIEADRGVIKAHERRIEQQRLQIVQQEAQLEELRTEMAATLLDIKSQQSQVAAQEAELQGLRVEISSKKATLDRQASLLAQLEAEMEEQRRLIEERNAILAGQQQRIDKQVTRIKDQKRILDEQGRTIVSQRRTLYLSGVIIGLVGILVLTIFRGYRSKRRANQSLLAEVAEREEVEKELRVAKEAAEAANRAKSSFLANMSHELRTPLNAILGYAQVLKRRQPASDVMDMLNTVQQSGEHLLNLINSILNVARIEAGRMELRTAPFGLPRFLMNIASIVRSRAEQRSLSFSLETQGTLPSGVRGDETRLRQVLLNLLDNAVKCTDNGGVILRVERRDMAEPVSAEDPTPHALLRFLVEDTGIGIPQGDLERIFRPFEQVRQAAPPHTAGTGLGLAISRQLVRLMGSDLHVESQPGRGSTFWFEVALPEMEVGPTTSEPDGRFITGYRGPRRRVLVADDDPASLGVLGDLLAPLGFELLEATNGDQVVRMSQEYRPDLILMDRWMPALDGLEAMARIRQIPQLRDVPTIMVSASVSKEDKAQSLEAGFDAFLPKPISWPMLAALLEEHLQLEWEHAEAEVVEPQEQTPDFVLPPKEEMAALHELVLIGDMRSICEWAARIGQADERYVPFTSRIHQLASRYQQKQVRKLVEQHLALEGE